MSRVVTWLVANCAVVLGCGGEETTWVLDDVCEGDVCSCDVAEDCVLTPYHNSVEDQSDCYCTDTSCGTSVPRSAESAASNQAEWEALACSTLPGLCSTTAHCALHPPERTLCLDGRCAKEVQR
jgi:hypothetical protein